MLTAKCTICELEICNKIIGANHAESMNLLGAELGQHMANRHGELIKELASYIPVFNGLVVLRNFEFSSEESIEEIELMREKVIEYLQRDVEEEETEEEIASQQAMEDRLKAFLACSASSHMAISNKEEFNKEATELLAYFYPPEEIDAEFVTEEVQTT